MEDKLEVINLKIKQVWLRMFKIVLFLIIISLLVLYIFGLKEKKYMEEYNSTTWYKVEAIYNYSNHRVESAESGDYYDWYFTYTGRDGNTYTYVEKDNLVEQYDGYTTTIYVDENDYSHSLKIDDFKDSNQIIVIFVIIIGSIFGFPYMIVVISLYIRKLIIKKQIKREIR